MIKVYAELGNIVIEQENNTVILTYAESDKLREEILRAQMKIKDAAKVVFVKEEK